jgi:hypothetical protein
MHCGDCGCCDCGCVHAARLFRLPWDHTGVGSSAPRSGRLSARPDRLAPRGSLPRDFHAECSCCGHGRRHRAAARAFGMTAFLHMCMPTTTRRWRSARRLSQYSRRATSPPRTEPDPDSAETPAHPEAPTVTCSCWLAESQLCLRERASRLQNAEHAAWCFGTWAALGRGGSQAVTAEE